MSASKPKPGAFLCDCGKWIMPTKNGLYRAHTDTKPEWPGSPFMSYCPRSGTSVLT